MAAKQTHTWWSVTAFNAEIGLLEKQPWPSFVRRVYGGRETCPETGTLHFQGAVQCWSAIRMAQLKGWLATAHLQPARAKEALIKYVMKQETAAGEKTVQENSVPHFSCQQMCEKLAAAKPKFNWLTDRQTDFWSRVKAILAVNPELAGQLQNPSLKGFYINTASVWEDRAIVLQHELKINLEAKSINGASDAQEEGGEEAPSEEGQGTQGQDGV